VLCAAAAPAVGRADDAPASAPARARVCVSRSKSERPGDPKLPVSFTLSVSAKRWRTEGAIGDHEEKCFDAPPGLLKIKYRLPKTELPESQPCSLSMSEQLTPEYPYHFFVGRPTLGGSETCPWYHGGGVVKPDPYAGKQEVDKDFVVLPSVSSYRAARQQARDAATRLHLKLDLRDASPTKDKQLTFSKATCDVNEWSYPCYVERGRYDDGQWVSVEIANTFDDGPPDEYVVVLASGPKDDSGMRALVDRARSDYPEVHIETKEVYLGCIHGGGR